jgi:hypothetical protein
MARVIGASCARSIRSLPGGSLAVRRRIRASPLLLPYLLVSITASAGSVAHADPKREVPDYDGRGNPDADAESWALWIPRIVLSPLYLTNELVLRRPLGAFITHAERERWADSVAKLFTFGDDERNKLVPLASFDLGLSPSIGLYYVRRNAFAMDNVLQLQVATWGQRWLTASVGDRYTVDELDSVELRVAYQRAEDQPFLGIGPDATTAARSRYGLERFEVGLGYQHSLAPRARLDASVGMRRTGFLDSDCCGDPSLDAQITAGAQMAPPGYRETVTATFAGVEVSLDTRSPSSGSGTGVYLRARGVPSLDVHDRRAWIRYGGVVGRAIDLTGRRRVLTLQLALDDSGTLVGDTIPFTEYATLGGDRMPGFVTDSLIGRSAIAAQLGYRWPVWFKLDARTRFTVGNVFSDHLDGLSPRKLRLSGDVGLTTDLGEGGFEILVGLGTETFEQGTGVTSIRVMLGSRRGAR